jgi:hypothetical protein
MTKTTLSKKMHAFDGEVAITPAQFYLFPHVAASLANWVRRAVPSNENR